MHMESGELHVGEAYHIDVIAAAFGTSFGWFIKGIIPRRDTHGMPYVLLFSSVVNPASSSLSGRTLRFCGEGSAGGPEPTGATRALLRACSGHAPIFGFRKERRGRVWRYLGPLHVISCTQELCEERLQFVFVFECLSGPEEREKS